MSDRTEVFPDVLPPQTEPGLLADTLRRVGDRLVMRPIEGRVELASGVILRLTFDVIDNTLVCVGGSFQAPEGGRVHGSDLAKLTLDQWGEEAMAQWSIEPNFGPSGSIVWDMPSKGDDRWRANVKNHRSTRSRTDKATLQRVAATYQAHPAAPTKAVADEFGVAHRTATLYVRRAREAGLLPDYRPGAGTE